MPPKVFEVEEPVLYAFLDAILKAGGMALQTHVTQLITGLKVKEQPAPESVPVVD